MDRRIMPTASAIGSLIMLYCLIQIFTFSYDQQINNPQCCDAYSYQNIADIYKQQGLLVKHDLAHLRSYFFPTFLNLTSSIFSFKFAGSNEQNIYVLITHSTMFILSLLYTWIILRKENQWLSLLLPISYAVNFLIYPFLSITLTESLSITLTILFVATGIKVLLSDSSEKLAWTYTLALLLGFLILIRPANIFLTGVFIFCSINTKKELIKSSVKFPAYYKLRLFLIFLLPTLPQLLINLSVFNTFSFFPTAGLGGSQVEWGKEYLKYGTLVIDNPAPLFYVNPFFDASKNIQGILWYITNPLNGFLTFVGHLYAALDIDTYFTYIFDPNPWYRVYLASFCHLVICGFIFGIFSLYEHSKTKPFMIYRNVFYGILLYLIGWIGVHGLSAPESRFSLPIYLLALPLAIYAIWYALKKKRLNLIASICAVLYLAGAIYFAQLFDKIKNENLPTQNKIETSWVPNAPSSDLFYDENNLTAAFNPAVFSKEKTY